MKKNKKGTIDCLLEEFMVLPATVALAPTTQRNYRYALSRFEDFYKKTQIITELDPSPSLLDFFRDHPEQMEQFGLWLAQQKISGKSIQQCITIAKLFLRTHGIKNKFGYKIPSSEKKRQQMKKINRWFLDEDVRLCMNWNFPNIDNLVDRRRYQLLIRLLVDTGARINEITHIQWVDLDPINRTVFLRESKTEPRPAFYSAKTAELVFWLLDNNTRMIGIQSHDTVFPTTQKCMSIITKMLYGLKLKSPRDGRGAHTFRHFTATKLYFDGDMNLTDLAILLGDKPETIRDHYLHPTPDMLRRKMDTACSWWR